MTRGDRQMGIKECRIKKHMTQQELADAIGVSYSVISKYENGKITPPPQKIAKIADVLQVSREDLFSQVVTGASELAVEGAGTTKPDYQFAQADTINNSYRIAHKVLKNANGHCELCGQPAPFKDQDGEPYLEIHFIRPFSEGGKAEMDNCAALCPNCNRMLTVLDSEENTRKLLEVIAKRKRTDS